MGGVITAGIMLIIYIPILAVGIVCMVLAIKLMRRGIKALDKYITMNS